MRLRVVLRPSILASAAAHATFVVVAVRGTSGGPAPAAPAPVPLLSLEARDFSDLAPAPVPEAEAPPGDPVAFDLPLFEVPPEAVPAAEDLPASDIPAMEAPETIAVSTGPGTDVPPIGVRVAQCRGTSSGSPGTAAATTTSSGPAGANGRPGRVVAPPRPHATNRPPSYPSDAVGNRWEGLSVLTVTVAADGSVAAVEVGESSGFPILDGAAERAIRAWTFSPALVDGVPADVTVRVPVRFRL